MLVFPLPGLVTETGTVPVELMRKAGTDTVMLVEVGVTVGFSRTVPKFTQVPATKFWPSFTT